MLKVYFTPQGQKDLQKLPTDIQKRVIKKIKFFSQQQNPLGFAKPLTNLLPTTHRFRIGDYRVAFFITSSGMYIDRIKHRKEVYNV